MLSPELRTQDSQLFYSNTVPTGTGCPARNSRMVILFFPSSWTSLMRKESFPVPTSMKSVPTHKTFPAFSPVCPPGLLLYKSLEIGLQPRYRPRAMG